MISGGWKKIQKCEWNNTSTKEMGGEIMSRMLEGGWQMEMDAFATEEYV